jgi:hypothetical protein
VAHLLLARETEAGIVLAIAVMYLRLLLITLVVNCPLAVVLASPLLGLSALRCVTALGW